MMPKKTISELLGNDEPRTTVRENSEHPYESTDESKTTELENSKAPYKRTGKTIEIPDQAVQMYGLDLDRAKALDDDSQTCRKDLRYSEFVELCAERLQQHYKLKNRSKVFRLAVISMALASGLIDEENDS